MELINSCDGIYTDSLDVRFTKVCDNRCPFCIERQGIKGKPLNVSKMIESTISSEKKNVLILGGEPFMMMEELKQYIEGIRNHVDKIYITTSLPIDIVENYPLFEEILNMIDGLNVSLQHFNDSLNDYIMKATRPHSRIDYLLKNICLNEDYAKKMRVSINLVKGGIEEGWMLDAFLKKMMNINVKHVKVNELQNEEELYVSFEEVFKEYLKKDKIRLGSPYSDGCQKVIQLEDYPGLVITVKRSCFCVNDNLHATLKDMFKAFKKSQMHIEHHQVVLYEDGTLSQGWIQEE